MPVDWSKYPKDWKATSLRIRARSGGRCECLGWCGLHQDRGNGPRRCVEINGTKARWAKGKVVLTVAHLDDDGPLDCPDDRLKALCQRCHLRMDMPLHRKHASATRMRRKEEAGQGRLLP